MATCPECEYDEIDTEDYEEGDTFNCPECGKLLMYTGHDEVDVAGDDEDDLDDEDEDDEELEDEEDDLDDDEEDDEEEEDFEE